MGSTEDKKFEGLTRNFDELVDNLPADKLKSIVYTQVYSPLMMEMKHKIKLAGILALVQLNIKRQEARKKNALEEGKADAVLQRRLESINFKMNGLLKKRSTIEHLLESTLIELPNGDVTCDCCEQTFKYEKTTSKAS